MVLIVDFYLNFKSLRAQITRVWSFAGVHAHVDGQVTGLVEAAAAHGARVALVRTICKFYIIYLAFLRPVVAQGHKV